MENYSYPSYPDSGDSSPRSREIDFENPPPWDDQQQQQQQQQPPLNHKPKFMCSYGGKIQPRTHDNQLSYVGGDTKILAIDRNIKFTTFLSKLAALCDCLPDKLTFKYQLPGEELDALISVTNEDDLDHMMHEYDRLYRPSRPARMRLFLFTTPLSDRDPVLVQPSTNTDFLFGLDKGVAVTVPPPQPQPAAVKFHDPVPEPVAPPPPLEYQQRGAVGNPPDRVVVPNPNVNHPLEVQRQLQRLQIAENDHQAAYRRKSEDDRVGNYSGGDYYAQKLPEKCPPSNFPANAPQQVGYWPEKRVSDEVYPTPASITPGGGEQSVYMIPAPGTFYHAPMVRPPATPVTQGYYTVQRMPSENYREAPVYGGVPPGKTLFSSAAPMNLAPGQPVKGATYTEGFGVVRPSGIPDNTGTAYTQVAYDSVSGRQVYYNAPGGMVHAPPYPGMAPAVWSDVRPAGVSLGQDGKVINKVSQGPV